MKILFFFVLGIASTASASEILKAQEVLSVAIANMGNSHPEVKQLALEVKNVLTPGRLKPSVPGMCTTNKLAYVHMYERLYIYLCPLFYSVSFDTRVGTLIHEGVHLAGYGDSIAYPFEDAIRSLARY